MMRIKFKKGQIQFKKLQELLESAKKMKLD